MPDLSAFILSYNEAENVGPLMDSLKGVRDVVVLDNGSDDGTQDLFKKRGARVIDGSRIGKYQATEQDVAIFRERFGFDPSFTAGELFDNAGERRNHAAGLCKNDWLVNPDCDERPEWDLPKVKAQMNGQQGLMHRYVFKHNPDGTPLLQLAQCKLYNRKQGKYTGWIHEVLVNKNNGEALNTPYTPDFTLHHYRKERDYRSTHLKQLQFQVVKADTVRNLHYLGRELADLKKYEESLAVYSRYFKTGQDFPQQACQAFLVQALCFRNLDRLPEAIEACHRAMIVDDSRRDPFFHLGQIYMELNQFKKALIYFKAAHAIPFNPKAYTSDTRLYTWGTHDKLSVCYQRLGMLDVARMHWLEALKYLPEGAEGDRILMNGKYMVKKIDERQET